jgi:hypothetical protein
MLTTPTEPIPTNPAYIQKAVVAVEEFLQRSGCSYHTKNAWLYLKNALHKLSTTQSTPPTFAEEEIVKDCLPLKNASLPCLPSYFWHLCTLIKAVKLYLKTLKKNLFLGGLLRK